MIDEPGPTHRHNFITFCISEAWDCASAISKTECNEVRNMKPLKYLAIMLVLLAAMAMIPCVSAAPNMDGKVIRATASQDLVDKINELWGRDITVIEYFEQVHPEFLVNMPDEIREKLSKKKWPWPDSSDNEIKTESPSLLAVPITCEGSLHFHPAVIHFAGKSEYTGNAPWYMAFATYLKNTADQVKTSTAASGYSVTYLNSDNMWQPDAFGFYRTHTTAFSLSPDYDAVPHYSLYQEWL
jgi:hypothetical protein